jgi:hypothetical protein
MEFNKRMSSCRAAVEWGFSDVSRLAMAEFGFSFVSTIISFPTGVQYQVAVLLANTGICIYGFDSLHRTLLIGRSQLDSRTVLTAVVYVRLMGFPGVRCLLILCFLRKLGCNPILLRRRERETSRSPLAPAKYKMLKEARRVRRYFRRSSPRTSAQGGGE